jgi:glycosyltransferase involved in cell wall biosynthesis
MSELLHVVHVVLSLDVGGLERNVLNQVRVADEFGQRVSVICVEHAGALADRAKDAGARVLSLEKQPGVSPRLVGRMRSALRELRPDVVHVHQIGPMFYVGLASIGLRIPLVVYTEHGRVNYAARRRLRWLGRAAFQFASRFYCLTDDIAADVVARHIISPNKVCIIQNGIDTNCFRFSGEAASVRQALGIPFDAPVVGTVGRLSEIKRHDLLIRAFACVRRQLHTAHLLLVGDGPLRDRLNALTKQLGVNDSVHFAGYQENTAPYYGSMTCFALTSQSEGMPQAVLEASIAGVPVIASRVGGLPEVIDDGKTGLLFEHGDEASLVSGLLDLLTNRPRALRLAEFAQARVESRFSIRRMAAEYHEHYLEMLGRQQQSASDLNVLAVDSE